MGKSTTGMFCLLLFMLLTVGCGDDSDPIESRLSDIGYTPELLVAELEDHLPLAEQKRRESRSGAGTKWIAMEDRDRGSTDERPDPTTFEAIIGDSAQKIVFLQKRPENVEKDILGEVVGLLQQSTKLNDSVKSRAESALKAKVGEAMNAE